MALNLEWLEETVYQDALWLPSAWELGSGLGLRISWLCGWFGQEAASVGWEGVARSWLRSAGESSPFTKPVPQLGTSLPCLWPDSARLVSMVSSQAASIVLS